MEIDELRLFTDLVSRVLTSMDTGSDWQRMPDNEARWITMSNKNSKFESLCLEMVGREDKLHIRANWPWMEGENGRRETIAPYRPYNHKGSWYEMNVSIKRKPADVANSIIGRLLLDYRKTLNELVEQHETRMDAKKRRDILAKELFDAYFPISSRRSLSNGSPECSYPYEEVDGLHSGELVISDFDRINLTLSMKDPELYRGVLGYVKNWADNHGSKKI